MRWPFNILCAIALILHFSHTLRADESLVTDISSHLISVTSDFTGTELLIFGAVKTADQYGITNHGDIIVVVRGPKKNVIVRKKERVAGIWANTESVTFADVPGFYAVASNRPLKDITDDATLRRLRIGYERLNFSSTSSIADQQPFEDAVIRQNGQSKLYVDSESAVNFLGNALFRTTIKFPAHVPVGNYIAEVYLFHNAELISAQTSPLFIKKFGIGRRIYEFAHKHPYLHGLVAIIISLLAGWVASAIFRKD
ncbi:TIGR02186 family protein [Sneathiella glossodoripedis]|uniref:TIGR02186 family protein n=1 Tax=Sneathiella glossodoripedis TaxID=418853 RepID=UPI000471E9CE|nr:TIGR02186 family protein [Sneathiella glossodoripedis]